MNDINNNLEQVYARINDPNYLLVTSLSDLYEMSITPRRQIIEDFLTVGMYMLVGPPKYGKSFMAAQIAVHVATGATLWGRSVTEGTVLYLALEDTYERLQRRLYRMFGLFETKNLYFALTVNKDGLEDQLAQFINSHPDTVLVIIDTLARVRNNQKAQSYLNDYEDITKIKAFADKHDIAILLIHHTRKQKASDSFEMISGTTGILGALDGAILMQKKNGQTAKPCSR